MNTDKIFKDLINQHECAASLFKSGYSFDTKQRDILFHLEITLRKHRSEQLAEENKVAALNKKIDKRQTLIDSLASQLEIAKSITELDINYDRE